MPGAEGKNNKGGISRLFVKTGDGGDHYPRPVILPRRVPMPLAVSHASRHWTIAADRPAATAGRRPGAR